MSQWLRTTPPAASVVIPAHDEARVIGRCLRALAPRGTQWLDAVVVANGCRDATAQAAAEFPWVRVLEIEEPSKAKALNVGDAAVSAFPRIFLDADITLSPATIWSLAQALDTPEPRVGAPSVVFDTQEASQLVRRYYQVFELLPYVRSGLVGLGVYGLSRTGRARFGHFPAVINDDLFVQRLFGSHERITSAGAFVVRAPRNLSSLIAVRTRVARGNAELSRLDGIEGDPGATTSETLRALCALTGHRPALVPGAVVYAGVTAAARHWAKRPHDHSWLRDESTR